MAQAPRSPESLEEPHDPTVRPVAPARPRVISQPHGRIGYDPRPEPGCRGCGEAMPCRNLACNHLYSPRVPPAPQKPELLELKIRTLKKRFKELKEREKIEDSENIEHIKKKQVKLLKRLNELKSQEKAKLPNFNSTPVLARPITPPSDTVQCLHCREVCSKTQADCPNCGGKAQGQCKDPACNKRPPVKHNPV